MPKPNFNVRSSCRDTWPPPPPADEPEESKQARQQEEEEAKRISDAIDRSIAAERDHMKRNPNAKILLLGQAESGKSTILKNFQLHFSPKAFQDEADIWRPIIHLNLVRSVNFIINFLTSNYDHARDSTLSQTLTPGGLSNDLRRLCRKLTPLRQVEEALMREISGPTSDSIADTPNYNPAKASEISIRSMTKWKGIFKGRRQNQTDFKHLARSDDQNRRILLACSDDIVNLWRDQFVQKELVEQDISLQEQPGFFLEDVARVTNESYLPTSEDILRARVYTIGPEEHHINVEAATDNTKEWIIYDVGGSLSQRATWAQFFDDVNMIIFLAPMSAFNQTLAEDPKMNRLFDSMKLWQMICSNKLLASVELILLLNKFDILEAKLKSGIRFSRYIQAYSSGSNDSKHVTKYLADLFLALHQQSTPRKKRKIFTHITCAIDTRATSSLIDRIHESIAVKILAESSIL